MREQGWYTDPYGRHERRWFSDGHPTRLVGDQGVDADDPPPRTPYARPPAPVPDSAGLTDADGAPTVDPGVAAAWELFVETGGD